MKAHVGNYGNEMADRLASDGDLQICYANIPISAVKHQLAAISEESWKEEWESTNKGLLTKSFFPSIQERLKLKIRMSPNLTTLLTGHGRINSYLHRFRIKDSPMCVCEGGEQSVDHIIYVCEKLKTQRETLKACVIMSGGKWPVEKNELGVTYVKHLEKFANSIDLDSLQ